MTLTRRRARSGKSSSNRRSAGVASNGGDKKKRSRTRKRSKIRGRRRSRQGDGNPLPRKKGSNAVFLDEGSKMEKLRVAVIGAGPSGLVAAKTLLENGYDVEVFEAGDMVGGTFRYKSYDEGRLVSSCLITAFSDFRMTQSDEDHPSIPQYLKYLEAYCDTFNLWPKIRFHARVTKIDRHKYPHDKKKIHGSSKIAPSYVVRVESSLPSASPFSSSFDAVCVSSGLHNIPAIPHVSNIDEFAGSHFHSSKYKKRSVFRSKRVLVVGSGETGLDIAYRAADARADKVTLVSRSGFLSVPHDFAKGVPLDSFITNLFESCYQHPFVERLKLKWSFTTIPIRLGFFLSSGSSNGFNQWAGTKEDVRRGKYIINKSVRAMPYINRPIKKKYWCRSLGKLFFWLYDAHLCSNDKPDIDVVQCTPSAIRLNSRRDAEYVTIDDTSSSKHNITEAKSHGKSDERVMITEGRSRSIEFSDGSVREVDTIVWCTGYRQKFPFLQGHPSRRDGLCGGASDEVMHKDAVKDHHEKRSGLLYSDQRDDALPREHNIVDPSEPNLAFIGFVRPNVGAIPPMSELQVQWWIQKMRGHLKGPNNVVEPASYRLLGYGTSANRTSEYAVDYGAYCHELAREIGSAPDLFRLTWQSPKAAIAYALGQSYVTFFRIQGPFSMGKEAIRISAGELFDPVWRRPLLSNLVFVAVIILFAIINVAALVVDLILYKPLQYLLNLKSIDDEKG